MKSGIFDLVLSPLSTYFMLKILTLLLLITGTFVAGAQHAESVVAPSAANEVLKFKEI